jgi:hypothetical protein
MATSDTLQLEQPVSAGGIRSVNFFNGRLLTSNDLSREQAARRESDQRLGLAIGDGVAFGYEVGQDASHSTPNAPVLRVKAGLAVNRNGQALRLTADISLTLARRFDAIAVNSVFTICPPLVGGTYIAGAGVYLLTVAPAEKSEGHAVSNGLDPSNVRCNSDATVEGLQFRLLPINQLRYADLDPAAKQFRNRLAYRCFGVEEREKSLADPCRNDPATYGLVDALRQQGLDNRDVPLALLYWTASGVQFIDMWAVRRGLIEPDGLSAFSFVTRQRRLVETRAMCAQFQEHLADLLAASASPETVSAADYFHYLPPFGMVAQQSLPLRGFVETTFFSGLVRRPVPGSRQGSEFVDARLLSTIRQQALEYAPTDTTRREFIWVFRPWQNFQALTAGTSVQPMTVFASGQMPDPATPRFDMARFDFSNYTGCCGGS